MHHGMFVNRPVRDLTRSVASFTKLDARARERFRADPEAPRQGAG